MEKKKNMMKRNDCKKCPYYYSWYDSWTCDGEEHCYCGMNNSGGVSGCNHSLLIRYILAIKEKVKEYVLDKRIRKALKKEDHKRIAMGMSEEEYFGYKTKCIE